MAGFFLALLTIALTGLGAGDQLQVASLVARQGQRPALLVVALGLSAATALAVGWAAAGLLDTVPDPARPFVAAIAFALAGGEMLLARRPALPAEPTRSLGAFGIVLLARQLGDGARFALFGLAIAVGTPGTAALGGALGAMLVVLAGWLGGAQLLALPLAGPRRIAGLVLVAVALVLGWASR